MSGAVWQDDQGWIQYAYLKHLEHHYKRPLFIDCAVNLNAVPGLLQANGGRISPNGLRNNCFAKNLHLYNLLDQHLHRTAVKRKQAAAAAAVEDPTVTAAPHSADWHGAHGSKYCILRGNTTEDRINLHDWNGDHHISNTTGEYSFVPGTGQYTKAGKHVPSECTLYGAWLYHGKNFELVNKEIKPRWQEMKERYKAVMNKKGSSEGTNSVSGDVRFKNYHSIHMFDFPKEAAAASRDVCGPVVADMLLNDALKNEWMAPSFKAAQASFMAEIGL